MNLFNMKAASALSGVSHHTMRAWERRYGAIRPQRSPSGQRLYSEEEVDRIRLLGKLTTLGHAISQIASLDIEQLLALSDAARLTTLPVQLNKTADDFLQQLTHALHEFDMERLGHEISAAHATLGGRAFVLDVVSPLLTHVGVEVMAGRCSIAQSHLLSALLRDRLGPLYQSLRVLHDGPYHFLFATTPGDLHEFGILLSAIIASLHGARTSYLGPNLPAEEIATAAHALGVSHVVIGLVPLPAELRKEPLDQFFGHLHAGLPQGVELWIGGNPGTGESLPPQASHHVTDIASFDTAVNELFRRLR